MMIGKMTKRRDGRLFILVDRPVSGRVLFVALVALSLAILLQLLPTTECSKHTTTTSLPSKTTELPEEDDEKITETPDKEEEAEDDDDDEEEDKGKSRSDVDHMGEANENSGVQKGTKTELPTPKPSDKSAATKDGIILHTDNEKAKAQKVAKSSTTTEKPSAEDEEGEEEEKEDDAAEEDTRSSAEATAPTTTEAPKTAESTASPLLAKPKIDDEDDEESRAANEAIRNIFGASSQLSRSGGNSRAAGDAVAANGTTTGGGQIAPGTTLAPDGQTAPANATDAANGPKDNTDKIKEIENSDGGATDKNLTQKIEQLGAQTKQLDAKKNSTIMINGRKFDQISSVECVDDKFYELLMHDLSLIDVNSRRDMYGTYYDQEYAKAVQAIVDTPTLPQKRAAFAHSKFTDESSSENITISVEHHSGDDGGGGTNKTGSIAPDDPHLDLKKLDVLADIRKFWNETYVIYKTQKASLDKSRLPMVTNQRTAARRKRADQLPPPASKPVQTSALENYQYLLRRLEELKVMILNGEEALIVMNNRVKKLNQAVGEPDLQKALCSCITSRSGRAAFSMMNELFVDKRSDKLIKDMERAKRRGQDAALDTAEFCAYWYGDTIRSQALQKEKEIKKLVLSVVRERTQQNIEMHFGVRQLDSSSTTTTRPGSGSGSGGKYTATLNSTEIIREDSTEIKNGVKYHHIKRRIVTKIVQMTSLWLPRLANWIKRTLNSTASANSTPEQIAKLIHKQEESNGSTTMSPSLVASALKEQKVRRRRRQVHASRARQEQPDSYMVSTPFDEASNYADLDDPVELGSSAILQAFIGQNYPLPLPLTLPLTLLRLRRAAASTSSRPMTSKAPATSESPIIASSSPAPLNEADESAAEAAAAAGDFETRIAERTGKCAVDGFGELLKIGFDQNSLMYETNSISAQEPYIVTLRETFAQSFAAAWREKRDAWSKHLAGNGTAAAAVATARVDAQQQNNQSQVEADSGRSVDEEIDNSFESSASSYDRGARLGYTVGKFIGEKAARQWPDPAELNTFTYDSLFLAGVGYGHDELASRHLERTIVGETAKRVAFTEANREAFARSLRTAYLNGALIVPLSGLLHAQRVVAKQAAEEAAKVGLEAASKAADEFAPRAKKFFEMHQHQRSLAAPYAPGTAKQQAATTTNKRLSDKWEGLMERIKSVELESELGRNLTKLAIDCGQKSATLMGALVGLIVTPEAFETYTRFRGSLEALENEFNQYKLGAMRGYELGESWAYLNYTTEMNQNLGAMKSKMEGPEGSNRADPLATAPDATTSSSTTASTTSTTLKPAESKAQADKKKKEATETVAAKVAQDQASHLAKESSASSLFDTSNNQQQLQQTNTNNIFQYMVLNYGTHLVANHSRKHMLRLRSLYIDEDLLRDLKFQSHDLIADSKDLAKPNETPPVVVDPFAQLFETGGNYIGELKGIFNNPSNTRTVPIRFNIIDLGPLLEFADDQTQEQRDLSKTPKQMSANSTGNGGQLDHDELKTKPITAALSRVGKVFMKFSVARKKKPHQTASDAVSLYLNSQEFDEGDGYLCGTFSKQSQVKQPQKELPPPPSGSQDDLSLEALMLDELFERIERAPRSLSTIELTESVMAMTTLAPRRVESIKDPQKSSTTTTPVAASTTTSAAAAAGNPSSNSTSSTTATPGTGTGSSSPPTSSPSRSPASKQTTSLKPTGSSRSAKVSSKTTTTTSTETSDETTTTTTTEGPALVKDELRVEDDAEETKESSDD